MNPERVEFETPENVKVHYDIGGLGSRFVAWVTDQMLMLILLLVIFIVMMIAGLASTNLGVRLERVLGGGDEAGGSDAGFYLVGMLALVFGLFNFFYYGLQELLMRGQTLGKRSMKLRVVKADGFALDPLSIAIRNIFRVLDHIPLFWIVPLFSSRGQRLGDMVAGTVLVADSPQSIGDGLALRDELSTRPQVECLFRFDPAALRRLPPADLEAIEQIYDRARRLEPAATAAIVEQATRAIAAKLAVEPPPADQSMRFMEELLAAAYQRQYRQLG